MNKPKFGRERRKIKVRNRIKAVGERPRLNVFRSNKFIYAQIIDDRKGTTLVSTSGKNSKEVGKILAEKALKVKITKVVFDKGPYKYHGRVKALAEGAREGGLQF